ncbi:MAG TPA: 4-hydroxy-tetrahydrodipicolinate synthase, partial [Lachnospiraceae bacterium]|nr:4-hydroxy-tetrahydrodipicolinate synthase [Lachnospiraceae bacterium]
MPIFTGAAVAIVTPMKDNYEVDYDGLQENIDYQVEHGCDCIVIAGTTGEGSTLSEEEHMKVVKAAVDFTRHRIPVVAGTGSNCTRTAIELSRQAEADGVDGLLIVTPYYNKATQNGLIRHYSAIAEEVKTPIILYNVPSRTGCNIQPETVAELVKRNDAIVGIKDATGNLSQAAQMMNLCDGNLELYSGNDDQVVPLLSLGGLGVISVLCNIAPQYTHDMVTEYLQGNVKKSAKMQLDAIP